MRGGGAKLPVLAEISGPVSSEARLWSLRREDFERLAALPRRLEKQRTVLVTGGDDVAGAAAIALAATACAAGRRTVLLECDLERPRLAARLGLSQAPGLHEYLRREATPQQILQPLALGGSAAAMATGPLVCISAGRQAADSRTLLGLESFRHMTSKLRSAYDLVVFGGPALGSDSVSLDAVVEQADAIIAGISPARASGRGRRAVRAALRHLPAPALGAVVVGEG